MESFGHQGRLEDERMLKGAGRYVSDWNLPRQARGHFLRSDHAHAEIVSIDILHHDEVAVVDRLDGIDRENVGMIELGGGLRLAD